MIVLVTLVAASLFIGDRWTRHIFSSALLDERASSLGFAVETRLQAQPVASGSGPALHLRWNASQATLEPAPTPFRLELLTPEQRAMIDAGASAKGVVALPDGPAPFFARKLGQTGQVIVATRADPGLPDTVDGYLLRLGMVTVPMSFLTLLIGAVLIGAGFKSIGAMQSSIDAIAAGNLDTHVMFTERRDMTGKLARAINALRVQLVAKRQVEDEKRQRDEAMLARSERLAELTESLRAVVSRSVDVISSAASGVKANSTQTLEAARSTITAMSEARRASGSAMESTLSASAVTEQLRNSSRDISEKARSGAELTSTAAQKLTTSVERIAELNAFSVRIDEVIALIGGIADQTKLLALNATIEAARAGAAGRGFSVVAQEVNALSAQTTNATEVIRQQIAAIQATTGSIVSQMDIVSSAVADAKNVSDFLGHAVHEHAEASESIAYAISQAATITTRLESLIATVDEAANHTTELSSGVQQAVEGLLREASDLKSAIENAMSEIRAA
jgi:methyl-accepting chemotaxis protein